jgi:hypothetical protein
LGRDKRLTWLVKKPWDISKLDTGQVFTNKD